MIRDPFSIALTVPVEMGGRYDYHTLHITRTTKTIAPTFSVVTLTHATAIHVYFLNFVDLHIQVCVNHDSWCFLWSNQGFTSTKGQERSMIYMQCLNIGQRTGRSMIYMQCLITSQRTGTVDDISPIYAVLHYQKKGQE